MTRVENDEIGVVDPGRLAIAVERRQIGHALGVVNVHLAAERLDKRPPGLDLRIRGGRANVFKRGRIEQLASPGASFYLGAFQRRANSLDSVRAIRSRR